MLTIEWNSHSEASESADEVDALLDRLHAEFAEDPRTVTVFREVGDSLSIGLGRELSVLCYVAPNGDPPYYISRGTSVGGTIEFRFGGEPTEYRLENAVPIAVARDAMRRFCESGARSSVVAWDEV